MAKVLVVYYSQTGNTEKMARAIESAIRKEGVEVVSKRVEDTSAEEFLNYEGIIIGSPCYYGTMAYPIKKLIDESVKFHGRIVGKVGGAFCSAGNIGGGAETVILSILEALLIHGMIVQGEPRGAHYGPVAIGTPDEKALKGCEKLGKSVANLVKKLFP